MEKPQYVMVQFLNNLDELRAWGRNADRMPGREPYTYMDYLGCSIGTIAMVHAANKFGLVRVIGVANRNPSTISESAMKTTLAIIDILPWYEREQRMQEMAEAKAKLDEMLKQVDDLHRYRMLAEMVPEAKELFEKLVSGGILTLPPAAARGAATPSASSGKVSLRPSFEEPEDCDED